MPRKTIMNKIENEKIWIIQRCIDVWTNHYEDWPGYSERLMTRIEMVMALAECNGKWPEHEFRGHNINSIVERHAAGEFPRPFKLDRNRV